MSDDAKVPGDETGTGGPATKRTRTLRLPMMILSAFGSMVLLATLAVLDASHHGPYATWFNRRCQQLADESRLVGSPESDVVSILGRPTFHYAGDDDARRTYNYAPWPFVPTAKFQVHCRDGIVESVEQLDD